MVSMSLTFRRSSGRAQRASARNQNGSSNAVELVPNPEGASGSQPPSADDSDVTMIIDDEPSISHSDSSQNILDQSQTSQAMSTRGKKKDKGKGKEVEVPVRVKEEPQTVSLRSPEPQVDLVRLMHLLPATKFSHIVTSCSSTITTIALLVVHKAL